MIITKSLKLLTKNWLLFLILVLAAVVRLWSLSSIPPHLTPDEASLGYNAYSILRTGKDEYGKTLPLIFKSFGDYKPGLYVYLSVPFVALFGLNELAVRLPGALAGVAAVWLLYLISRELFKDERKFSIFNFQFSIGEIAAFLLAISPWHIHFSRGAWEASVSLTLTLAGTYFFLKSLKNSKFLIYASIFFSLTFLTYQGAKLATTLAIIALVVTFWKEVKQWFTSARPGLAGSICLGLLISLPIILSLFQGRAGRLEVFSIFSYERPQEYLQTILDQGEETFGSISYNLFHSEGANFARGILGRWFNHFSGRFLLFEGDYQNLRHSAPNHGMLLLADLILLIVGFIGLVRMKGKSKLFILLWLILAPLPAALSRDQVHAVRALNMVIPLTMLSAIGLTGILRWIDRIKSPMIRYSCSFLLIAMMLGAVIYYLDSYFVHLPVHNAKHWFYGYKQAIEEITPIQNNYQNIVFQQSYNQPYIYFLFYGVDGSSASQGYDPVRYQAQAKLAETGIDVGLVESLDNISFSSFSWPYPTDQKGTLVIADSVGIPHDFKEDDYKFLSEIKYPDNFTTAFRIVEIK